MASLTFPQLFATSLGVELLDGDHRCFWCGASCDGSHKIRLSDTFWDHDAVAYPRSSWQCAGCSECLNEKREIAGYSKPQKTRNHSWFVVDSAPPEPLNKKHLDTMRERCLNPPSVRWGFAIAESGQKHVMFRTPVNEPGSDAVAVQLELTTVTYRPDKLKSAIDHCARIASVIGKPCLSGEIGAEYAYKLYASGVAPEALELWNAVWNDPLWRLAAFLCPGKADCHDYLGEADAGGIPPATGWNRGRTRTKPRTLF